MILTKEDVRASGGIVHSDGNVFFTNLEKLNAAILAKLASAELPEPAGRVMEERNGFVRGQLYRIEDRVDGKPLYTADQLREAYAQGAAAQLSDEPAAKQFQTPDGGWNPFLDLQHQQHTEADGRWPIRELYTRRQA